MTPLEPDFAKHLRNVLTDLAEGQNDGVEEAFEAIMTHPGAAALGMKVIEVTTMNDPSPRFLNLEQGREPSAD